MRDRSVFTRCREVKRRRNQPPDQTVKRQQICGKHHVRRDPPEEKPDVHYFPSRDAVRNDQTKGHQSERSDRYEYLPLKQRLEQNRDKGQEDECHPARGDELQFDLLDPAAPNHTPQVENNYDESGAGQEGDVKREKRTVNRLRNQAILCLSTAKLRVFEEGMCVTKRDCRDTQHRQRCRTLTDFCPPAFSTNDR